MLYCSSRELDYLWDSWIGSTGGSSCLEQVFKLVPLGFRMLSSCIASQGSHRLFSIESLPYGVQACVQTAAVSRLSMLHKFFALLSVLCVPGGSSVCSSTQVIYPSQKLPFLLTASVE